MNMVRCGKVAFTLGRLFRLAILLVVSLDSCSRPDQDRARGPDARFVPERGVVFADSVARRWSPCSSALVPSPVQEYWSPPGTLITRIEQRLPAVLDSALQAISVEGANPRPSDYYRQYLGLVVGGRRLIYVNGFHGEHVEAMVRSFENIALVDTGFHHVGRDFWKRGPVSGCDGGWWFFGVTYDPDRDAFGPIRFEEEV